MKTCLIALFLCAASLLPQAMAATPADVARKSFQEAKIKAEKGDAAAQFALGLMYAEGRGVPKDEAEAYKWYLLAGAMGHKAAKDRISEIERKITPAQRAEGQRLAREWKPRKP